MTTIAQNNIIRDGGRSKSMFESVLPVLSTSVTYNQGDLIAFDNTNKVIKAVSGSGDSANFLGVARQTIVSGLMPSPVQGTAVDASQAIEDAAGPAFGVVAFFKATASDVWNPGDKAYLTSTDAQTITSVAAGSAVGIYQGPAIASATAGQPLNILVNAVFGSGHF